MAQDTYTPTEPDHAECIYCGYVVHGAPAAGGAVRCATLVLDCPQCGGTWHEGRDGRATVTRWTAPGGETPRRPESTASDHVYGYVLRPVG